MALAAAAGDTARPAMKSLRFTRTPLTTQCATAELRRAAVEVRSTNWYARSAFAALTARGRLARRGGAVDRPAGHRTVALFHRSRSLSTAIVRREVRHG